MIFDTIITIDPGAGGAIAILHEKKIQLHRMPKSVKEFAALISKYNSPKTLIVCEQVQHMPFDSKSKGKVFRIAKMMKNFDKMVAAFEILEMNYALIVPRKWQNDLKFDQKGVEKAERKRMYQRFAKVKYPNHKVFLWNADALCIMHWTLITLQFNLKYLLSKMSNKDVIKHI